MPVFMLGILAMMLLTIGGIIVMTAPGVTKVVRFFQEWKSEISKAQGKDKVAHVMLAAAPTVLVLGFVLSFIV